MALDHSALVTHLLDARSYLHDCVLSLEFSVRRDEGMSPRRRNGLLLVAVGDATSFEVVGGQLNLDAVARQDPDVVHAHLSGDMRQNFVAIFQFDSEHGVWEGLNYGALQYDCVLFWLCQWNLLL